MTILILNCGSSSIKYQVVRMKSPTEYELLVKGVADRIGLSEGVLEHKPANKPKCQIVRSIPDHSFGINLILNALVSPEHGVLKSITELSAVGHRVAHGGEYFKDSAVVDKTVKQHIEDCFDLAPLHNPANLKGILAMENILPTTPQVAVFDTSFHQTIPPVNYLYGLPYKYYEEYRIRKYGFHGTSHKYVAQTGAEFTGIDFNNSKIITCHLGNGASITAIKDGHSFDTSMGFTPVDGLIMGTRCGATDPGALIYIAEKEGLNLGRLNDMINKESGLLGISGISSDMRDVKAAADRGDMRARIAMEMFAGRIRQYVGAYVASMGGADLLVFTGGIGENEFIIREMVCRGLDCMGIIFDSEANDEVRGKDVLISKPESKVKVAAINTNEELVIALDTFRLTKRRSE